MPLTIRLTELNHWGRVTHICIGNLTIIGSGNGLSPGRCQAITWTNVGILLIGPLGTNFSEMLIKIHTVSVKKIHLKISPGKWRPCCLGLNVLMWTVLITVISALWAVLSAMRWLVCCIPTTGTLQVGWQDSLANGYWREIYQGDLSACKKTNTNTTLVPVSNFV